MILRVPFLYSATEEATTSSIEDEEEEAAAVVVDGTVSAVMESLTTTTSSSEESTTTKDASSSSSVVVGEDKQTKSELESVLTEDELQAVLAAVVESPSSDISSSSTVVVKEEDEVTPSSSSSSSSSPNFKTDEELIGALLRETDVVVDSLVDESCEVNLDDDSGNVLPLEDLCVDDSKRLRFKQGLKRVVGGTLRLITGKGDELVVDDEDEFVAPQEEEEEEVSVGEILERGWETRGNSSALRRNAEVWKFALSCVFKALKPRKLRKSTKTVVTDEEIQVAQSEAATFIRDGLLRLGPTFVKLGQVLSTRTDVLPPQYTDVLKTLQDDVPGFSGQRAKDIVTRELGKPYDHVFQNFSDRPLAAASLGQVHTATYQGKKVAIKVQRQGLKDLFDVDLKNLKKLAELLDKFDPKTDGADRNWVSIYEESERLLYLEIDYLNEADNSERFARDFSNVDYVRVPDVYRSVSTPRVLVMEFVESFKLTDLEQIDPKGLDRDRLAKRAADAFLKQIVETGYFHCDPHPGNLCVDDDGNLVYYDYGMMDELQPNVRSGFRKFCTALFQGGPTIDDAQLARNAKLLVDGVEEAGVLARNADRLAVEKLARYFMRSFKDTQLGKKTKSIKQTVGTDLQTLTENNVFRFPSTFTFIFRSFASVDGIGKGLDPAFDIGLLAQPFVEAFIDKAQYSSPTQKKLSIFSKATGLNLPDINTAITSPRKIAYVEETLRAMENGNLKIRVRSLENEKALERMVLTQTRTENLILASVCLNAASLVVGRYAVGVAGVAGAALFAVKALLANAQVNKFDKTQLKFINTEFQEAEMEEEE